MSGGSTHHLPRARGWMVIGLIAAFAVSFQQITQPDYNTHTKAPPSDWLWVVVPGLGFAGLLAWRMMKSRVETSATGLRIVRVFGVDVLPWSELKVIEVRSTPNRGGFVVNARHTSLRLTKLGTIPGRSPKRRAQADAFAAAIEADRRRFDAVADKQSTRSTL